MVIHFEPSLHNLISPLFLFTGLIITLLVLGITIGLLAKLIGHIGLIICTSTGSTAYSMAAGGPIVHPDIDAMIINPICPMSLASRPIVIPNTSKVIIKPVKKSKGAIKLWRDGSKCMTIKETYYCEIKKGNSPCKIIKFKQSANYYNTLIKKLDWKGDLSLKNRKN